MKSASGNRPPDGAHGPGEETIRPQQCSEAWGRIETKVHTGTLLTFAPYESDRKTMKSASGKRPPDEAHGPGKEAIRPLHRS